MASTDWIRQAVDLGRSLGFTVRANEPMSRHTSFRVGGPADALADPSKPEHVKALQSFARHANVPFTIIGEGTNLIVRDGGVRGIVCRIGRALSKVVVNRRDLVIRAQAGALLRSICHAAAEAALTGLEWAVGIPGCIGGAVVMNAGAHGGCIGDSVVDVRTLSPDDRFVTWTPNRLAFGYRKSALHRSGHIVLEVRLAVALGDEREIRLQHERILKARGDAQPLEYPSAGSIFKRPPNDFAGRLIEEAQLKNVRRGGAIVSDKHAGFIVNEGNATARDVIALIEHVRAVVRERTGVELEPEVIVIGDDEPPP